LPENISQLKPPADDTVRKLELREERLVAHKELVDLGDVVLRTTVDDVPARLELEARREEVEVTHVPVGKAVSERRDPWEEGDELVIPIYEEELVAVKRLVLREELRVRRIGTTVHPVFEDTVRKERLTIEDPNNTGFVREIYPTERESKPPPEKGPTLVEKLLR